MRSLFAEAFLVPVDEPDGDLPRYTYDEGRSVNVLADGRAVVQAAVTTETSTLTKVRSEHDDRGWLGLDTITKVARESSDRSAVDGLLGTETRVPNEREDFVRDLDGGTHTAVRAEAEDFARDAAHTQQTRVAR